MYFNRFDIAHAYHLFSVNFSYIKVSSDEATAFMDKIDEKLTLWGYPYSRNPSLVTASSNTKSIYMGLVRKWAHLIKP